MQSKKATSSAMCSMYKTMNNDITQMQYNESYFFLDEHQPRLEKKWIETPFVGEKNKRVQRLDNSHPGVESERRMEPPKLKTTPKTTLHTADRSVSHSPSDVLHTKS